jgi:acyl-coenzyme A synthetase/AMP-(fatty) acid ligase
MGQAHAVAPEPQRWICMSIVDTIFLLAQTVPHRLAVIQSEMITTYQGLADALESIGERIERLNLNKREPVAVCLANPSFLLATILALMRNGHVAAPVTMGLYPHLAGAGIGNLIYDTSGQVTSTGRNIRFDMSWLPEPRRSEARRPHRKRPNEAPDMILFTSKSMGRPEKVVQSAAILEQVLRNPVTRSATAYQKILILPGPASGFGFNRICEALNLGKTVCFAPDALSALSLINLFGIEAMIGSTAQVLGLAEARGKNPGYRVDSLRTILFSGGKVEPDQVAYIQTTLCRNVVDWLGDCEY